MMVFGFSPFLSQCLHSSAEICFQGYRFFMKVLQKKSENLHSDGGGKAPDVLTSGASSSLQI